MKAKTKTPAASPGRENKRLFPEMKKSHMTAIDRKIHALLTAEGYAIAGTQRLGSSLNVNRFEYLRGKSERVFITTHKPIRRAKP